HRAVARAEQRVGHAGAAGEQAFRVLKALLALVVARRNAERALELALQVKRAQAHGAGELFERHALAAAVIEVGARLADWGGGFHGSHLREEPQRAPPETCSPNQPAMVSPPETEMTCPVMNAASSEARKATSPGISSGWPTRFMGIALTRAS